MTKPGTDGKDEFGYGAFAPIGDDAYSRVCPWMGRVCPGVERCAPAKFGSVSGPLGDEIPECPITSVVDVIRACGTLMVPMLDSVIGTISENEDGKSATREKILRSLKIDQEPTRSDVQR